MVTAIILATVERGKIQDVAQQFLGIDGVTEVYSVAGRYDMAAMVRVPHFCNLADLQISKVGGIIRTETLIAFQAFSKVDLERIFSAGQG